MRVDEFGILRYYSDCVGVGGVLRKELSDFVVEEVLDGYECSVSGEREGFNGSCDKWLHATLVKWGLTTHQAVRFIEKQLKNKVGYAGLKDKWAVTAQRISIPPNAYKPVRGTNFFLKDFSCESYKIHSGCLKGNKFNVLIRSVDNGGEEFVEWLESNDYLVPNFFGVQRFGFLGNTHLIGKYLSEFDFERAGEELLKGRGFVERHFRENCEKFGFKEAFKRVSRRMLFFYLHAYQSYLFNKELSELLLRGEEVDRLELWGGFDLGLKKVRVKKGLMRDCFMRVQSFELEKEGNGLRVKFFLPKGCYATVLLNELMKP